MAQQTYGTAVAHLWYAYLKVIGAIQESQVTHAALTVTQEKGLFAKTTYIWTNLQ